MLVFIFINVDITRNEKCPPRREAVMLSEPLASPDSWVIFIQHSSDIHIYIYIYPTLLRYLYLYLYLSNTPQIFIFIVISIQHITTVKNHKHVGYFSVT